MIHPQISQFTGTTNTDGVVGTNIPITKVMIPISNTNYTGYLYVPAITRQGVYAIKVIDNKDRPVTETEISFNYIYWGNL